MQQSISLNSQNRYEVKVYGMPDDSWLSCIEDADMRTEVLDDGNTTTTFCNIVMDQAGLVGLIRRLHGLGIVLLSVQQV